MKSNRVGRFFIDADLIDRAPKAALAALSGLIVVRAEYLYERKAIEYAAIGEGFDAVPTGQLAPYYDCQIKDLVGGKYHVTFKRL